MLIKKAFDLGFMGISKRLMRLIRLVYAIYKLRGLGYIYGKFLQILRSGSFRERLLVVSRGNLPTIESGATLVSGKKWVGHIEDAEVIVVSNAIQVASYEYRARNIARAFSLNGYKVYNMEEFDFINSLDLPESVGLVYFCRTTTTPENIKCWERIRDRVQIAFDVDDLIFSAEAYNIKNAPGLLEIPEKARRHLTGDFIRIQREIIENCDFVTAPTQAIVEAYSSITTARAFVVPNVLPNWMIEQALDIPRKQNSKSVIIGYASGTSTHSGDFATAADGIWQSLRDNPNAILKILGASPISVSEIPKEILSQVRFQPLVPHEELLTEISTFDVNLAPLELNPFTEAKSELKFVHAAILGIPTIASPTEPFRKAINHSENGYLAKSSSEWHISLNNLIESETLRKSMGFQALLTLRGRYTVSRIAQIFQDAPNLLRVSNK